MKDRENTQGTYDNHGEMKERMDREHTRVVEMKYTGVTAQAGELKTPTVERRNEWRGNTLKKKR